MPKTLCVRAVGTALVTNYEAMSAGVRRYIGRKFDESVGDAGGFVPTHEAVTVPYSVEYHKHLVEGDLEPADEATARVCGLKWEAPKPVPAAPKPSVAPAADKSA